MFRYAFRVTNILLSMLPTAQALAENTALIYLDLRQCDIDADGMALLLSLLKNKSCVYHDIDLSELISSGCLGIGYTRIA